jgi:hypothetical protein
MRLILRFEATKLVQEVSEQVLRNGTLAVVQGERGLGKSCAAQFVQEKLSVKGVSRRILRLNCKYLEKVGDLARYVAKEMGINPGKAGNQMLLDMTKRQLTKRHVRLILADDADALPPPVQQYLLKLIENVEGTTTTQHKIGLVALVADEKRFTVTASKDGHHVLKRTMPKLSPTEVATYLCGVCPQLKQELGNPAHRSAAESLVAMLCKFSGCRPRTLDGLLSATLIDQAFEQTPSIQSLRVALKRQLDLSS